MMVLKSSEPVRQRDGACDLGTGNVGHGEPAGCTGAGLVAVHIPGHGRFVLCPGHVDAARTW